MIHAITVTNYLGASLRLVLMRPEESGFIVKSVTGLGPSKANVNTTSVSTNDGSIFNSAWLEKRNIVMSLQFYATGNETIEDVRQKSYKYFPIKKEITLVVETDNRILKTIGYVESNEPDIFSKEEGCQISIICPDPLLYSAGEDGINKTAFYGARPNFEFPFENNSLTEPLLEMSIIEINTENNVIYNGDAEIGITISVHAFGSASGITIYNIGTRQKMAINSEKLLKLTGSDITAGDTILICTKKGNKSIKLIRDSEEINILNCLEKGCDWFTLAKGDNIFSYTAVSGGSYLQFRIENENVYDGV